MMKLKPLVAKNAKPKAKPYKLADGGGLYLEVFPNGSKLWRLKYRRAGGVETRISLGKFPDTTVLAAREAREQIKRDRRDGVDPAHQRRTEKAKASAAAGDTFEVVGREWLAKQVPTWSKSNAAKIKTWLEAQVFPYVGTRAVSEIEAPELLAVLRRIESRGRLDTAHRIHQVCGQIFRYAVATGRAQRDPSGALRGALAPARVTHRASLKEPKQVGALLRAIGGYTGSIVTKCALRLAPLVFVRPGELRHAEWPEFDFDRAEWRIPAAKMKMGKIHIVPLAAQAVTVLREIQQHTGHRQHVFPGERGASRPMSENTLNAALRYMGYKKEEMTAHGFRSIASSFLHELGWKPQVIERQLAHTDRDKVAAAYNHAEHLPERKRMMQAWADHLDALESDSGKVVSFARSVA